METQKTLKSQSSLEKRRMEMEESIFLTSDYTTKLQSAREYGPLIFLAIFVYKPHGEFQLSYLSKESTQ